MTSRGFKPDPGPLPGIGPALAPGPWVFNHPGWVRFGVTVVGLSLAFIVPLLALVQLALKSDLFSHILLVPLVAGYLIWVDRGSLPLPGRPSIPVTGSLAIAATSCLALSWLPVVSDWTDLGLSLQILAWILGIATCGSAFLGRTLLGSCVFPLSFLLFAVPMPEIVVDQLETLLQYSSAEVSDWLFQISNVSFMRDGLFFEFPGLRIQVAKECSGIRSTLVLFVVGVLASKLFLLTPWKRLCLVAFVVPLGILRNAFRVWTLAVLTVNVDSRIIHSWFHHRGGPIFFALSLVPFFAVLWALLRSERRNATAPAPNQSTLFKNP